MINLEEESPPKFASSQPDAPAVLLGDILVSMGLCDPETVSEALMFQKIAPDKLLGEILIEKRHITEEDLARAVAQQYSCKYLPLIDIKAIDERLMEKINPSKKIFLDKCFIALKGVQKTRVVVYKPDFEISTLLVKAGVFDYELAITTKSNIYDAVNSKYFINSSEAAAVQSAPDVIKEAVMIASAKKSANIRIKFASESFFINIDTQFGTVEAIKTVNVELGRAVIRVLAEWCSPKVSLVPGHSASSKLLLGEYDIRVEFLPAESAGGNIFEAVMRIHYSYSKDMFSLKNLGFSEEEVTLLELIKTYPNGIIVWTGPTGSGKTTTIYASLKDISATRKQIYTIEDPVENHLSDINITQLPVKEHFGFDEAIRSVLRCEPKILMVGEIRDKLTAEAAATASDTGHLVLTTVHANSALSVFRRLESLGVKPQRIVENIKMAMGQRLYLPLCPHCRIEKSPLPHERNILRSALVALTGLFPDVKEIKEIKEVFEHKRTGCQHCSYTGYAKRRQAQVEIAVFDDEMRDMVSKGHTLLDIEKAFVNKKGFVPLSYKAYNLLYEGSIDLNQYYQITNIR